MTFQPGTRDAQVRCDQAQRRIDELVERNREIGERLAALHRGVGDTGPHSRSTMATAEQAGRSAHRAHDLADEAHVRAAQAHRRAAVTHDEAARRFEEAAAAGVVSDEQAFRVRAAQHARDASENRAQAAREERR
jgi:hypothetical protein